MQFNTDLYNIEYVYTIGHNHMRLYTDVNVWKHT